MTTFEQQTLGRLLKRASESMVQAKSAALKPVGLTLAQYVMLSELDRFPGLTGAALARACLVTPQAMLVALKSAEEQGLIVRTPHPVHANVIEVHLTDVGRETLALGRMHADPIEQRMLDPYSDTELETFRNLLIRFIEATT